MRTRSLYTGVISNGKWKLNFKTSDACRTLSYFPSCIIPLSNLNFSLTGFLGKECQQDKRHSSRKKWEGRLPVDVRGYLINHKQTASLYSPVKKENGTCQSRLSEKLSVRLHWGRKKDLSELLPSLRVRETVDRQYFPSFLYLCW